MKYTKTLITIQITLLMLCGCSRENKEIGSKNDPKLQIIMKVESARIVIEDHEIIGIVRMRPFNKDNHYGVLITDTGINKIDNRNGRMIQLLGELIINGKSEAEVTYCNCCNDNLVDGRIDPVVIKNYPFLF